MSEHFYENLRNARLRKGLSQKELAEKLGVARSSYCMYESGDREPNIITILKIADLLDVSTNELLGYDEEPQTVAAHFDGDDFTEEELKEIQQFAAFVKSKRSNNLVVEGSTLRNICNDIAGIKPPDVDNGPSVVEDAITKAKKNMSDKTQK